MTNLNLARKWRSKNFDEIVGQELSVRMLKNSLYLNQFFPVYLFSGQRGCGKTSLARIFAAALNCSYLPEFQQHPKNILMPCLTCGSCMAMAAGNHPDFFEIDAASHTGVDTIRQIIDDSMLVPLMGAKKVYLIDEAHMLSKASFNALLKILEEPPQSVLFILATTDAQKIIETVKSRCFQLLFKPIATDSIIDHLTTICAQENIPYDDQGLRLIVQESEGSMRDAINMLEQVRFSSPGVYHESVLQMLGHMGDAALVSLLVTLLTKSPKQCVAYLEALKLDQYSAEFIWKRFIELLRAALWIKHDVDPHQFHEQRSALQACVQGCSWLSFNAILDYVYSQELLFLKTTHKHALLEMIFLQICIKQSTNNESNGSPSMTSCTTQASDNIIVGEDDGAQEQDDDEQDEEEDEIDDENAHRWQQLVHAIELLQDPLLLSLFRQAQLSSVDQGTRKITLLFNKEFAFFDDWLRETQQLWLPSLQQIFGHGMTYQAQFTLEHSQASNIGASSTPKSKSDLPKSAALTQVAKPKPTFTPQVKLDVSDPALWPNTHALLKFFPGTVTEVPPS